MESAKTVTKPFLRWAGGKSWLTKCIEEYVPSSFNDYYEPFIGGGSIFIYLKTRGIIKKKAILSDLNPELINAYEVIQCNVGKLIDELKKHRNEKNYYYEIREKEFTDPILRASKFIYLNRTSYNGIYRENLKGVYNVPFGNKSYKELFDFKNMVRLSEVFTGCKFLVSDFQKVEEKVNKKDFVFVDPPYTVAHGLNGFIKYNQKIFSWEDQIRLKDFSQELNKNGTRFIITNAYHESILDLYKNTGKITVLSRPSVIGGTGAKRTHYDEIVISNIK
jgi:DNA adenine methylase